MTFVTRTRAPQDCCFASAFFTISDEKRDGDQSFPDKEKAGSVSPLPAHIALQGGERAGTDAMCSCPPQDESL